MFEKSRQGGQAGSSPTPNVTIGARELIESAPDIIFACDESGHFQWLNSAVEVYLGQRPADLLGRPFLDLVPTQQRKDVARFYMGQNRDEKEVTTNDVTLQSGNGDAVSFTARVRRVLRPDGDILFVGCARPAVSSPHASVPVRDADSPDFTGPYGGGLDLDGGTTDPQELTIKLDAARNEAELKSDFLSTMSHEMRAPMNGILGMTELLLESELDPNQRSLIEVIQNSSQSLLNLVNDTVAFTKAEKDSLDIQSIDFDLRHTIEEVASLIAPMANERGLGFECSVSHVVPSLLRGDPALIRQVVLNLAHSAIKLTESGQVTIGAERTHEDDDRVSLRFTLQDTGLRLDDSEIAKVFDAWSQADTANARKHGAAGLALGVARKIVESMGGDVGVATESTASGEGGTRFWFRLPLEKQSAEPRVEIGCEDVQMRGLHVLVVDPSAGSREQTMGMLTAWGCIPEGVASHTEALAYMRRAAAEDKAFALALIEMQLPEVDGEGLGRIIRDDASLSATRLMLLTNTGSRGDAHRLREIGFSAYMVRPVAWSSLYDAAVEVMGKPVATKAPQPLVTRHSVAEARRGRIRVLLVEDNAVNQLVAESVIRRLGFSVQSATNGTEAIAAVENEQFDLVLMDLQMPHVDGLQATAALRARERGRQHTPIVAMTATAKPDERQRCIDAGMDEYLTKPLDLGQLTAVVERFAGGGELTPLDASSVEKIDISFDIDGDDNANVAVSDTQGDGDPDGASDLVLPESDGSPGETPALDTSRLEESCMGIPALRETLLKAFLTDVRPRLEALRGCVEQNEARRIEFEAHGLKGMCATVGANACLEVFAEMEDRARQGDLSNATELIDRGGHEVERAEEYIRRLEDIVRRAA